MASSTEVVRTCSAARWRVEAHVETQLGGLWQAAPSNPGSPMPPAGDPAWIEAPVPGTAAGALARAGRWRPAAGIDLDACDWWFRSSFKAEPAREDERLVLRFDGVATIWEATLNGAPVAAAASMFEPVESDVTGLLGESNELVIHCRSLAAELAKPRRPRARWKTRLVGDNGLRFHRTMLIGRLPGIAPEPAAVGPWRGVTLARRRLVEVAQLRAEPTLAASEGRLELSARLRPMAGAPLGDVVAELERGGTVIEQRLETSVAADDTVVANGTLVVPGAERWWPHTHGPSPLYELRLRLTAGGEQTLVDGGNVGFRELTSVGDPEHDRLELQVNGTPLFARGAVWTPPDPIGLAADAQTVRAQLELLRESGMNMVRITGTGAYETAAFHDACDSLGILVWQDLMFANMDYPIADPELRATVEREVHAALEGLRGRPSTAVVCGNSDIDQQVAMLGLERELSRGPLFGELIPQLVAESGVDAVFVPSAPCGGDQPSRPNAGVGTYYGVGCYELPLEDARRAEVGFAAECMAFSHVPGESALVEIEGGYPDGPPGSAPAWKAGIPREHGADWDFEDVRDHYLEAVFGVRAADVRHVDRARYLELSRVLTGEVLAEVFGEWRRERSPCAGALVLWWRDLLPGAGWGLVDHRGEAKPALRMLARVLAPVAVWTTDERLGGVAIHLANDGPDAVEAELRVATYRDRVQPVDEVTEPVSLAPHRTVERGVEELIGRFVDAAWAYRFSYPAQDLIVVSLERDGELLSQAMRHPAGWPLSPEPLEQLGLDAVLKGSGGGPATLEITSERLAYGVRIHAPGLRASDDCFPVEPGGRRVVTLTPTVEGAPHEVRITAVNARGSLRARTEA
jgi:beta-mannosidase